MRKRPSPSNSGAAGRSRHTPPLVPRRSRLLAASTSPRDRHRFLPTSGLLVAGATLGRTALLRAADAARVTLPFARRERALATYPEKTPAHSPHQPPAPSGDALRRF